MAERYKVIGSSTLTSIDMPVRKEVFSAIFDEQLRVLDSLGKPFASVSYVVELASGRRIKGVTDFDGRTERITTGKPVGIESIELYPTQRACCALHATRLKLVADSIKVSLQDITTHIC